MIIGLFVACSGSFSFDQWDFSLPIHRIVLAFQFRSTAPGCLATSFRLPFPCPLLEKCDFGC